MALNQFKQRSIGREAAIALAKTGWWKRCDPRQVAEFQLSTEELCCDMGDFQMAVEKALGRPVWTHELARPANLRAELMGDRPAPSFQAILDMIR